ncbi:MAG TPA: DUF4838 domain-containing protein [Opitutaceae bacterium]|nr:DUF4838 domain-containing protein [Opitutaceae bacterium]
MNWITGLGLLAIGVRVMAAPLPLAQPTPIPIVVARSASEPERFAAQELARYLGRIVGQPFAVATVDGRPPTRALVIGPALAARLGEPVTDTALGPDGFLLRRDGGRVIIAGANGRATLYAAYAFLEQLGCRWFAPNFDYYGTASGEYVPRDPQPAVDVLDDTEKPSFPLRELFVEEGESYTAARLAAVIDWMAKVHLNILCCPIDYQGEGRTKWDNWRAVAIPAARERGITLEVGGHGYQVFLPAGRYFAKHPDWFGIDRGRRSSDPRVVFSTANPDAVAAYVRNLRAYLVAHPEIDTFDWRPPDSSRWSTGPEDVALGSPSDRQIRLLRQVMTALAPDFPHLQFQFEAYSALLAPPDANLRPPDSALMEFCPINRSFTGPIFDPRIPENRAYYSTLEAWIHGPMPAAHVSVMTYLTKYVWRSLPVLLPHLIAAESANYARLGLGGMSTYAEPGCWATYEVDHYFSARYLWNAFRDPDAELAAYATGRFGPAATGVLAYLRLVESVVPRAVLIPGTRLDAASEQRYLRRFGEAARLLDEAKRAAAGDTGRQTLLAQLDCSRRYTLNEMELRAAFLEAGEVWRRDQMTRITALLAERQRLIAEGRDQGVILDDARLR